MVGDQPGLRSNLRRIQNSASSALRKNSVDTPNMVEMCCMGPSPEQPQNAQQVCSSKRPSACGQTQAASTEAAVRIAASHCRTQPSKYTSSLITRRYSDGPLADIEQAIIQEVLRLSDYNKTTAARYLGLTRFALDRRLKKIVEE